MAFSHSCKGEKGLKFDFMNNRIVSGDFQVSDVGYWQLQLARLV
jgi:hypothetical protein